MAAGWSAGVLGRILPPRSRHGGVLLYHRTCARQAGVAAPTWNVCPEQMRRQLVGLKERGFHFVRLEDVLDALQVGRPFPSGAVAVTFDDGYENNFHEALPILQELEIPACFLIATAYIDSPQPFPFDRWALDHQDRVLQDAWLPIRRESLLQMIDSPLVTIGSHTHTHLVGSGHDRAFEADTAMSLHVLEDYGVRRPIFAFPAGRRRLGHFSDAMLRSARGLGVRCALTTDGASPLHSDDGFVVGRFNVFDWDTPASLEGKLSGWFEWAPRLQEWLARRRRKTPAERALT